MEHDSIHPAWESNNSQHLAFIQDDTVSCYFGTLLNSLPRCHPLPRSWNIPRAVKYREINKISGLKGTAVNVQSMVYGNINEKSGTGVCFTRNPANGNKELFGEFLMNAQVGRQPGALCVFGGWSDCISMTLAWY